MSVFSRPPTEPSAAERTGDPGRCHACGQIGSTRAREMYDGQELWLCADFKACMQRTRGAS